MSCFSGLPFFLWPRLELESFSSVHSLREEKKEGRKGRKKEKRKTEEEKLTNTTPKKAAAQRDQDRSGTEDEGLRKRLFSSLVEGNSAEQPLFITEVTGGIRLQRTCALSTPGTVVCWTGRPESIFLQKRIRSKI